MSIYPIHIEMMSIYLDTYRDVKHDRGSEYIQSQIELALNSRDGE